MKKNYISFIIVALAVLLSAFEAHAQMPLGNGFNATCYRWSNEIRDSINNHYNSGDRFDPSRVLPTDFDFISTATLLGTALHPMADNGQFGRNPGDNFAGVLSGDWDNFSIVYDGYIRGPVTGDVTFWLNCDNGFRLIIGNDTVIDHWINDWEIGVEGVFSMVKDQFYPVKLEYFEHGGGERFWFDWWCDAAGMGRHVVPKFACYTEIPSDRLTDTLNGLTGTYYEFSQRSLDATASLNRGDAIHDSVNIFDGNFYGTINDLEKVNEFNIRQMQYVRTQFPTIPNLDTWAARYEGFIKVPADGNYSFYGMADNGFRVYLSDSLIIDQWKNDWDQLDSTQSSLTLKADTFYSFKVEFVELAGGEYIQIWWGESNATKTTIPKSALFTRLPSTDTTLSALSVGSKSIALQEGVFEYTARITAGTDSAVVATATNSNAVVTINNAASIPGVATVVVVSESSDTATYTINIGLAATDATLSSLSVGETNIALEAGVYEYNVKILNGADSALVAVTNDTNASAVVTDIDTYPGVATVVVTAEDGVSSLTYTVNIDVFSSNATLSSLHVGSKIVPLVNGVFTYNVSVAEGADTALVAVTTNENASVVITDIASVPGSATVVVTAEDGITTNTYTVNISRSLGTDATLSVIMVGDSVIVCEDGVLEYEITVGYGAPVEVSATLNNDNATAEITQISGTSGTATIVVTAQDQSTTLTYTVIIASEPNNDATLSTLAVGDAPVTLVSGTYTYNVEIARGATSALTATTTDAAANAVITNATAIPGTATVLVTADDGSTQLAYTVNISYIKWTDATLATLAVGDVSVTLVSGTYTYNIEIAKGASSALTATTTDTAANAVITNAGAVPGAGTVVVTADDGTTQLTYTVNISYIKSTDATLASLKVGDSTIVLVNGTYEYTIVIGREAGSDITAVTTDAAADAVITQAGSLPGSGSVVVTAEDGTTKLTYTVNISELPSSVNPVTLANVTVYPNPAGTTLNISNAENSVVEIFNSNGQLVKNINAGEPKEPINIDAFEAGLYIVVVKSGNQNRTFKISIDN
ncbi:MAG: T9SS type A sorting domain-containing protein [Bacteroidales bacterium]|nr:T9SS type A sorting domain-containing protein [Bacteroidales bacterium]